MSVGALLLQPQRLPRSQAADGSASELGDAATLLAGIAFDAFKGGHVADTIEAAGEAFGQRLLAQAESGLQHATTRLTALVETPLTALHAKAVELGSVNGADAALAAAHDLLGAIGGLAEALTIDHIRATLAEVVDIIETDFGLTPNVLEQQAWAFIDDLVDRLEHVAPESDVSLRRNRLRIVGALRRLRRRLFDEFHLPQLDVEQLAEELFALIRQSGITDAAARTACVGAGVAQIAQSARDILHVVPFTGLLPSTGAGVTPDPPADDDRYQWYPSWLANNHRPFLVDLALVIPDDSVWITNSEDIVQRNVTRTDQVLATGTHDWKDFRKIGDDDGEYSFGVIPADAMETIAWISSIVVDGLEMIFQLASLEEGDYVSNIVNAVGGAGYGTWKAVKRKPFPWYIEGPVVRGAGTFGASFEGVHTKASFTNCFMMWLTLAGPDFAEMLSYRYWFNAARDFVLSALTLMNHVPPSSSTGTHPRNRDEVDGIRQGFNILFLNLYLLAFKRTDWGIMKNGDMSPLVSLIFLWTLLFGSIVGSVGGLVGSLVGCAIARDVDSDVLEKKIWWGIPQAWGTIPYWLYLQQEGSTSGGTYTPFAGAPFSGYPPKASSPYMLPYNSSAVGSCYVGQANEGFWSHNFGNVGQVYAYDFSLDQGSEVLASRPGTVIAYSECITDDFNPGGWTTSNSTLTTAIAAGAAPATIAVASTSGFQAPGILQFGNDVAYFTAIAGNTFTGVTWRGGACANAQAVGAGVTQQTFGWNFIAIRHDTAVAAHDIGQGGTAITTVSVFGHGRRGSISAAFGRHTTPVPPEAIIGSVVKAGMPIMDAGDTGVSFHNHLHMHVIPDPGGAPGSNALLSNFGGIGTPNVTIPFVFADSDVGNGGVPTHFNWYTSANPRTLA